MRLEVLGEVLDTVCQEGNLHLGRAGIAPMLPQLFHDTRCARHSFHRRRRQYTLSQKNRQGGKSVNQRAACKPSFVAPTPRREASQRRRWSSILPTCYHEGPAAYLPLQMKIGRAHV